MARIPEAEIARLVKGFGVELKRHGAELVGTCPFPDDKTPSLVVSPKSNLWHCLGACSIGESTIDWAMRAKGVSFRHAIGLLQAVPSSFAAPVSVEAEDREALRYLERRGMTEPAAGGGNGSESGHPW